MTGANKILDRHHLWIKISNVSIWAGETAQRVAGMPGMYMVLLFYAQESWTLKYCQL